MKNVFGKGNVYAQLFGLCSAFGCRHNAHKSAYPCGAHFFIVMVCSNVITSIVGRFAAPKIKILCYVFPIAVVTAAVDMMVSAFLPAASVSLLCSFR